MSADLDSIAKDILSLIGDEGLSYKIEDNNISWGALKDCERNIVLYKGSHSVWHFPEMFQQGPGAAEKCSSRYLDDIARREAFASDQAAKKAKKKPRKKVIKQPKKKAAKKT